MAHVLFEKDLVGTLESCLFWFGSLFFLAMDYLKRSIQITRRDEIFDWDTCHITSSQTVHGFSCKSGSTCKEATDGSGLVKVAGRYPYFCEVDPSKEPTLKASFELLCPDSFSEGKCPEDIGIFLTFYLQHCHCL